MFPGGTCQGPEDIRPPRREGLLLKGCLPQLLGLLSRNITKAHDINLVLSSLWAPGQVTLETNQPLYGDTGDGLSICQPVLSEPHQFLPWPPALRTHTAPLGGSSPWNLQVEAAQGPFRFTTSKPFLLRKLHPSPPKPNTAPRQGKETNS